MNLKRYTMKSDGIRVTYVDAWSEPEAIDTFFAMFADCGGTITATIEHDYMEELENEADELALRELMA